MSQTNIAERKTLSVRPANSRKLLARKAAEQIPASAAEDAEALEACFPADAEQDQQAEPATSVSEASDGADTALIVEYIEPPCELPAGSDQATGADEAPAPGQVPAQAELASEPESAPSDVAAPALAPQPASAPAWYSEDESVLNAMLARRKAAGFQRRGRDVSGQLVRLGDLKPNPNTVVAVIVGLVAEAGGTISRAELVERMGRATFPHAKARPGDKGWCQGYIGGAARASHLALTSEVSTPSADRSAGDSVSAYADDALVAE